VTGPSLRGAFRDDPRARAAYAEGAGIYRIVPRAVARPADAADVQALVRWAAAAGVPLIPRGAGSGMAGANVGEGVVADLSALAPAVVVSAPGRTARTAASVPLGALNAAAAPHGLRLPPDPSSGAWATVGGVIGTNAAGPRSMRYGSVRPWVLAAEVVTAEGEVVELRRGESVAAGVAALRRFAEEAAPAILAARERVVARWPRVRKSSTGYALDRWLETGDVLDLVIGAEGTLGIVTAATWRLDPLPTHRAALRLTLRRLEDLGEVIPMLVARRASAAELLDQTFLRIIRETPAARAVGISGDEAGVVLVEFEGRSADEVDAAARAAAALAGPMGCDAQLALSPAELDALLKVRKAASPILAALPGRRSLQVVEDACVPVERIGEYVAAVREAAGRRGLDVVIFGHAGDGNLHVNLLPELDRPDWTAQVAGLYEEVTAAVVALGGVPSGEHGDGRLRAGALPAVFGEEIVALFRRVKHAFDPRGILNPGIKVDPSGPPVARLKAAPDAAPIPDDIAQALRRIEREGGYAEDRLALADGAGVQGPGSRV
jgi:FAD/FMN-containing dehydrogenase